MYKNILFFLNCPVPEAFVKKYCLSELISLGYKVSIVDISLVVAPVYSRNASIQPIQDESFEVLTCCTQKEIDKLIFERKNNTFFFPMFDCIYDTRVIFCLLTKHSAKYGYVNALLPPVFLGEKPGRVKLVAEDNFNIEHLKKAFYHRIIRKIEPLKRAEFICFCGTNGEEFYFKEGACGRNTKRVYLYSFDYENLINTPAYNEGSNYCVFLDQYVPFHPDSLTQLNLQMDADDYYSQLEIYLDTIKEKMGLDIIIAAHPQSNYKLHNKYLTKYKIEYGITGSLIKNAELVCTHFSTAAISAVAAEKPLMLLNMPILKLVYFQKAIQQLALVTGCPVIDSIEDIGTEVRFHAEKYEKCRKENIAREEPDGRLLWERILNEVPDKDD